MYTYIFQEFNTFTRQCNDLGITIPSHKKSGLLSDQMGEYGIEILERIGRMAREGQTEASKQVENVVEEIEAERMAYNRAKELLPELKRNLTTALNNVQVSKSYNSSLWHWEKNGVTT